MYEVKFDSQNCVVIDPIAFLCTEKENYKIKKSRLLHMVKMRTAGMLPLFFSFLLMLSGPSLTLFCSVR